MTRIHYLFVLALLNTAFSADPKTFKKHWLESRANKDGLDAIQHQAAGPGWFSNLGPTGIRALLTDKDGKTEWKGTGTQFVVKFVFPGSPAYRKVLPGDTIVGANGSKFRTPYAFGYWFGWGYEGPLTDFGKAMEASERDQKGKIEFMLLRKGEEKRVNVVIPSKGVFGDNFPFDCPKSLKLRKEAIAWLLRNQRKDIVSAINGTPLTPYAGAPFVGAAYEGAGVSGVGQGLGQAGGMFIQNAMLKDLLQPSGVTPGSARLTTDETAGLQKSVDTLGELNAAGNGGL